MSQESDGASAADLIESLRATADHVDGDDRWLGSVATIVSRHLDAPCVRIWSATPDADRLLLRTAVGPDLPFEALQDNVPVGHSELGQVVTTGTPYIVPCDDAAAASDVREWANRDGVKTFHALPILANRQSWGVMAMFARRSLNPSQQEWLSEVATIIGQAVASAGAESARSTNVDLLSSLVPCLSSAVVTLDRSDRVTHWSGRAERMFGWSENEALGRPLPILSPERKHEFVTPEPFDEHGTRIVRSRTVCRRADLRPVPVERTSGPLVDRDGHVIGRIEVLTDDSMQVRTSRCLHVQGQVARILAGCHGIDDGLPLLLAALGEWLGCEVVEFWMRDDQRDVLTRPAVWAGSSATRDRLTATNVEIKADAAERPARLHRQDQIIYEPGLNDSLANRHDASRRVLRRSDAGLAIPVHRDGLRLGVVLCSGDSLEDPDELTRQTLCFSADALAQFLLRLKTQAVLAQTESNLRQSQKMDAIGLLAGGVAHDFNNLLTVILAYSEMGLDEVDDEHPLHEMFAEIHAAGERAARMTQQLLAVSRQQPTRAVRCNLNRLVREMDRMLGRLLGPQITLVHDADEGLANIHADANQLEQVLLNLVVNARDAMPGGGSIVVATRNVTNANVPSNGRGGRSQPFVELSVTDTGCGMDEATRLRIFEPFFTTKAVGHGTGMGLSTVFGIVQQNGGVIDVESEVNVGTKFSVFLPQANQALATQSIDERTNDSPTGTESILVVEHDESVRALIRRLLEVRGYTVVEAADGRAARDLIRSRKSSIDLILADVQLPIVEGVTLTRLLKERKPGQKILLTSGNTDLPPDVEYDWSPHVLHKPFTSRELAVQIRLAIDRPSG